MRTDWNAPLPFTNGSIERILCHLSLSFTSSPLHCLRQMLQVLHPDGTAVVTCLQPHTDLSTLFRHHLLAKDHNEFGSPAKIVLHYLGGMSWHVYWLMQVRAESSFSLSSRTNFYSPLYGRPNLLGERAFRVYTSNLVMIRRLVSITTNYADGYNFAHQAHDRSWSSSIEL
jgi:SAM-dependent methyltransferase